MAHRAEESAVSEALAKTTEVKDRKLHQHARRTEAVSMALAGLTYEQIGNELKISPRAAQALVSRTIEETRNYAVDEMRQVENARLDRAQAAIWSSVIAGDQKAINTFLRISERRARMNGLDAPAKVQMAVSVRQEMEHALQQLEHVILEGEVEPSSVTADEEPHHVQDREPSPQAVRQAEDIAQKEEAEALSMDYSMGEQRDA